MISVLNPTILIPIVFFNVHENPSKKISNAIVLAGWLENVPRPSGRRPAGSWSEAGRRPWAGRMLAYGLLLLLLLLLLFLFPISVLFLFRLYPPSVSVFVFVPVSVFSVYVLVFISV